MGVVIIKIALGVCACLLAVLSVAKVKTLKPSPADKPWYTRLTKAGTFSIVIAIATLGLGALNEKLTYDAKVAASKDAAAEKAADERRIIALNSGLTEAKGAITSLISETANVTQTNAFLVRALDKSIVRADTAIVQSSWVSSPAGASAIRLLPNTEGRTGFPEKGDIIEWNVTCIGGAVPRIEPFEKLCHSPLFGNLVAFSQNIAIDEKSGKKTLSGSLSNDHDMVFQPASYAANCEEFEQELRQKQCSINLTFWRQAGYEFTRIQRENEGVKSLKLSASAREACRTLEVLYGQSCAEALEEMDRASQ